MKDGKTDMIFVTSENFRLQLVIGHTVFFTTEKNCTTNQIAGTLQWITFIGNFIWE